MVEEAGYRVIGAANADDAMAVLEAPNEIGIVLSDVNMPGSMNGMRLIQMIRLRWPAIRLVLCSGKPLPEGLPSGAVFLEKPYSLADVTTACNAAA